LTSLAIKLLVCFVENSFLFSALRLPARLYVSLLFVFFFVQFSKATFSFSPPLAATLISYSIQPSKSRSFFKKI
ncbi:hypothetical protein, partial [Listeria monocytogenes]|uniref:hypothetical protein n=1 Tax=Listeria monocytogenes TaxID=1639 RepID=UPI001F324734